MTTHSCVVLWTPTTWSWGKKGYVARNGFEVSLCSEIWFSEITCNLNLLVGGILQTITTITIIIISADRRGPKRGNPAVTDEQNTLMRTVKKTLNIKCCENRFSKNTCNLNLLASGRDPSNSNKNKNNINLCRHRGVQNEEIQQWRTNTHAHG